MFRRKKKQTKLELFPAQDVLKHVYNLIHELDLTHISKKDIFCMRSKGSNARAYARIWGLSRIFQVAAGMRPTYVIEVLSERFDKLSHEQQIKVLIHELMHIPKTFSGALLSHRGKYHRIDHGEVEKMFKRLKN
ncbi:hypothetical protein A3H80_04320 [Candidatus Roizmanbacteria bacterium RIFCSPLOWO2_02_FULL_37_19]|uniref:Putative phage metallopeptidase domain-containing protein n=1 Tax=Candidatus Roizmanbacteria bacterium RIFCSPHIGHO2_02_FULL_37_24 TaxID=1802037 RepID=A0A1F7GWC9_9BACT|nr:MAG: hypothetical protein A2862_03950 [Candidatus Roizmanbacteria bacterium RIFCSPHIGHO2_01_FULL_38_41]OGK23115.1 MAG: hypothetical protein A3C24_01350 [Candidatus Roizmanbacteria bacterium RIFCSPHIGHO2_02_FULL_37_24]OGK32838.1 MAG: hypothetical protein A3E10_00010 [Candidatus Roizmanbacteria bacterium RIFCSPHIGHO2_12_FULL_37_23]OGK45485.1 MAG: hypothetical protein A2956_00150 [Candidatus Roizmanbacteria bacterium RIFCSPLOWO2_01_FULL_37_57]OGK54251.1 MAG: hypothetical protein A3H80_04320 [Ca